MRTRFILILIFAAGLLLGASLILYTLVLPQSAPSLAQEIATPAPTPMLPGDDVFAQADAHDQIVATLYQRVSPSVLHITSRAQAFSPFYGVVPREGTGSGFAYDDQGHIVTNNHVVANANEVSVVLADGTTLDAEVVGTDPYYDLAVLRVDLLPNGLTPLELGDSANLLVGQSVVAIGNPFGLDRTLTTGVISALGRQIQTEQGGVIGEAIQTDAAINPGNSGGPLLDLRGRVVGINTAINSPSGGSVGIGFAVPVDIIKQVVPALISDGHYAHPSLGVQVAELGREVRLRADDTRQGLLIVEISAGSGAQAAGLQAADITVQRGRYVINGGDIITAINGEPVTTRNDMQLLLEQQAQPGDTVTVTILRDDTTMDLAVTLDAQ